MGRAGKKTKQELAFQHTHLPISITWYLGQILEKGGDLLSESSPRDYSCPNPFKWYIYTHTLFRCVEDLWKTLRIPYICKEYYIGGWHEVLAETRPAQWVTLHNI